MGIYVSFQRSKEEKEQRIAVLEEAKAAVEGEVGELRANLREVEKSRMEARRELQELRRQVCCITDLLKTLTLLTIHSTLLQPIFCPSFVEITTIVEGTEKILDLITEPEQSGLWEKQHCCPNVSWLLFIFAPENPLNFDPLS